MSTLMRKALSRLKQQRKEISSFSFGKLEQEYELTTKVLSKDSRSVTYLGKCLQTNDAVSVKVIDIDEVSDKAMRRIINEFKVLRSLRHPNIATVFDIYNQHQQIYVVSEYICGETLSDKVLDESYDFSEDDCRFILKTVVSALKYCKDQGVVHRNIVPENIIFSTANGKREVKIVDFQWSKQMVKDEMDFSLMQTMCGKPIFVAPEIVSGRSYNYKCDIWSLGVVLYLILSGGYIPFGSPQNGNSLENFLKQVKSGRWSFQPVNAWREVSDDAKNLLLHMLKHSPQARFSYEQIMHHKFLQPYQRIPDPTAITSIPPEKAVLLR